MKKVLLFAIVAALAFGMNLYAATSVTIKLDRPKVDVSKMGGKDRPKSGRPSVETKNSTSNYEGKISCSGLAKGETATITLEAYFITRTLGRSKNYDVVEKREEVGKFTFGGEEDKPTQEFAFSSPQVTETETSELKGGRRNRHVVKSKSGKKLLGVIVRAIGPDKKILKVVTEPNNPAWIKLAKEPVVRVE